MFLCHPISIKHEYDVINQETIIFNQQSSSGSLIYFALQMFWQLKQGSTLADIDYPDLCIFIFKENCTFMEEKDNPVEKANIDEEELDGIEIYVILNFEKLPRTVLIG